MRISIITVVWNNEKTIRDAIDSIAEQTHENIEHIIVDGKSTDGTIEIVKSYGSQVAQFISEKDKGIYDAMNKGLALATGDIIGILNSDDVYTNEHVIARVAQEFKNNNTDSVFADLDYVDQNDLSKVVRKWRSSKFVPGSFAKGWHPAHPTFFVKKEVYEKYGTFDLSFQVSADFELMLRLLEKHQISSSYIPEVLVKMRNGGESNGAIKNILLGNKNIRRAFVKNGINVSKLYTPKRLASKVWQRIKK